MDANPDGDEYNDNEEYLRGSDLYTYEEEIEVKSPSGQFWKGVIFGDFVEDEEVDGYVLVGQIAGGFVPVVADGRDVIANVSKGDILMAILSGAGFFPGLGDAAKGLGDLGQVIVKLADDTPTIARLLIKTADEHPYLVKAFSKNAIVSGAVDDALHSPNITKDNWHKLVKIAGDTNGNFDVKRIIDIIPNQLKQYGRCDEFAECFVETLEQNEIAYKIIRVDSNAAIYSDKAGCYIGINYHYGIQVEDVVYDNMTPDGMKLDDWLDDLGLTLGISDIEWNYTSEITNTRR